jgi:D-sedoheptulose 7-phosphate isomerase
VFEASQLLVRSFAAGGTVWACGNGGSATQAQHLVAELVGRFKRERSALRAICLSDNTATVTAVANDYEFADVFARQVRGLARAGDCLVALSTSGNSENVVRACRAAREAGAAAVAVTGASGGRVAAECDVAVRVPESDTPRIQEVHLVVIHLLCEIVETALAGPTGGSPPAAR